MAKLTLTEGLDGHHFATLKEYGKKRYYSGGEIEVYRPFLIAALSNLPEGVLDHLYQVVKRRHENARTTVESSYVNWDMTKEVENVVS